MEVLDRTETFCGEERNALESRNREVDLDGRRKKGRRRQR